MVSAMPGFTLFNCPNCRRVRFDPPADYVCPCGKAGVKDHYEEPRHNYPPTPRYQGGVQGRVIDRDNGAEQVAAYAFPLKSGDVSFIVAQLAVHRAYLQGRVDEAATLDQKIDDRLGGW